MILKSITICQPWAWAILHAGKNMENRSWYTAVRGPLLIHAGKSRDWLPGIKWLRENGIDCPDEKDLVFGAIVGQVELVDCIRPDGAFWGEGPWCHVYEHPMAFNSPIPFRGGQGFFGVPSSVVPEYTSPAEKGA